MDRLLGTTLGRYRIEALLGRGNLAAVYRATDSADGQIVALRVFDRKLAADRTFAVRFRQVTARVAGVQHPNLHPILDYGVQDGVAYLVRPYVAFGTLRKRLGRPLPAADAVELLRPVAAALDHAHAHGLVHGDLKPGSILLRANGQPLLADLGTALVPQPDNSVVATARGANFGTPEYLAPEQAVGSPFDGRADLYSLGVILYEALTGRPPFRAEGASDSARAIVMRHLTAEPPAPRLLNPALSPAVERVLLQALAKGPGERYPTGAALFAALDAALAEGAPPVVETPSAADEEAAAAPLATDPPPLDPPADAAPARPAAPWPRLGAWNGLLIGAVVLAVLLVCGGLLGVIAASRGRANAAAPATTVAPASTAIVSATPPPAAAVAAAAPPSAPAPASPDATTPTAPAPATSPTAAPTEPVAPAGPAPATPTPPGPVRQEVILFTSRRGDGHESHVHAMAPDGMGQRRLAAVGGHAWGPRIAPDGRSVAFSALTGEHADHGMGSGGAPKAHDYDVYIAAVPGANPTRLAAGPSADIAWSWSPDGQWLLFTSNRDGDEELYKMTAAGEQLTRLTNSPGRDTTPTWTPDGKRIIFASERVGGLLQLHAMDADGANVVRLVYSESDDLFPAISPDGKRIVYVVQAGDRGDLFLVNTDGSNATRLTDGTALNTQPAWSPDGSKVAFASTRDGASQIYVMNADGSGQTRLSIEGVNEAPTWGYLLTPAASSDAGRLPPPHSAGETPGAWLDRRANIRARRGDSRASAQV